MPCKPHPNNTAIVITDLQNDYMSPGGRDYHLTKGTIERNNTIQNLELLMRTAMNKGYQLFISPHYLYPHDNGWQFTGNEQKMLLGLRMYQVVNAYAPPSFRADFVHSFKPYIFDNIDRLLHYSS
ncbi:hypothetical protein [Paenibacillus sp. FJAT-27812]|uniref:hypothetical protein n=1 Tax=Paenibacillus sp. FJAT-27812 TaxID=1684143 RepID=UPI000AD7029C|nr:hypothetical protein [Paenibacillus sp. FJAT-27812]